MWVTAKDSQIIKIPSKCDWLECICVHKQDCLSFIRQHFHSDWNQLIMRWETLRTEGGQLKSQEEKITTSTFVLCSNWSSGFSFQFNLCEIGTTEASTHKRRPVMAPVQHFHHLFLGWSIVTIDFHRPSNVHLLPPVLRFAGGNCKSDWKLFVLHKILPFNSPIVGENKQL